MTTVEQLLLIVDRAERGSMLADEAALLRTGIRELAREAQEGACAPVSRPNSPRGSTGTTGAESASEARGASDSRFRPKGTDMPAMESEGPAEPAPLNLPRDAAEEIARLQAERDQLNRDCDARDETIRHLDAGLTREREQVARLEAELVAARSTVDRGREAVPVIRRALKKLPSKCMYHDDTAPHGDWREACCDTGIAARRRELAEQSLNAVDTPHA